MNGIPAPVRLHNVNHYFGEGDLRKQILFDIDLEIGAGEIVIVTGPSGSGKTTVLTLAGALRSGQEGSVSVLGQELIGAGKSHLAGVRRQIGYIFQHHNLLDSLDAVQNVQMGVGLQKELSQREMRGRSIEMLEAVGLGDWVSHYPRELSGGQKQRVAIARALVREPKIILADEPTASLDKKSGRDAVELMQRLAKEHDVTVVLVTHDNRILDIADRIIQLEDGRVTSFSDAVLSNTKHMMGMLAMDNRRGDLVRRVADMSDDEFTQLFEQVTEQARKFIEVSALASNEAFESMLEQMLVAFTRRIGDTLDADRASLFLVDEAKGELWSKVARDVGGEIFDIRIPLGKGIAGAVAASGKTLNIPDAYSDSRFEPAVDRRSGYRTKSLLCVPLFDSESRVFGVAQLLNKAGGEPFDSADEERFGEFMASMGLILESWWRMSRDSPTA
jgi:putative ABC transport system ATP-binding protein